MPAHVKVRPARNALSLVLVITNGGSLSVIGLARLGGGDSDKHEIVSFWRTVDMGRLCWECSE